MANVFDCRFPDVNETIFFAAFYIPCYKLWKRKKARGVWAAGGLVQVLTAAVIGFFFLVQPGIPYDRLPPFQEEVLAGEIRAMSQALQEKMEYTSHIGWENTVVWLAYDIVDGEIVAEQWQQLYALPGGYGINYCSAQYILDNLEELQARYIAAIPGGQVEELLLREGAVLLEKNDKIAVYCRTVVNE